MAKPKLALIPASQGTKVYSVLPSDGSGDFDFTRSSKATRINSQGLIEEVLSGQSRLDYPLIDGVVNGCPSLLLEPQSTNLVTYSEDFSNSSWIKTASSVTSGFISPDGTLNAFKMVEDTSTSSHKINSSIATTLAGVNSISIYIKKGELKNIGLKESQETGKYASFDLVNLTVLDKAVGVEANINSQINGWIKVSMQVAIIGTSIRFSTHLLPNSYTSGDPNGSYTGDGTSGVYIFGAQVEQGSFPTSYIKTNGESGGVTRSADTATGAGDASTFSDSEGVLMAEISALADDGVYRLLSINNGTSQNQITIGIGNISNNLFVDTTIGGSSVISNVASLPIQQEFNKILVKYKSGSNSIYFNGFKINSNSNTFTPTGNVLNQLEFSYYTNTLQFYGKAKQIQYYDSALTDSELEKISSWTSFIEMVNAQQYSIK